VIQRGEAHFDAVFSNRELDRESIDRSIVNKGLEKQRPKFVVEASFFGLCSGTKTRRQATAS